VPDAHGTPGNAGARDRLRAVLDGATGIVSAGVTFVPDEAIASLLWGGGAGESTLLARAMCGDVAPDFVFVVAWAPGAQITARELAACGIAPFIVVRGPVTTIAEEDGWAPTLRATLTGGARFDSRLDAAVDAAIAQTRTAAQWGAFAVVVAEDVASASGPLVEPGYVPRTVMPRIGRIASAAHAEGLAAIWHSDGDVTSYLSAAAGAGFDGVHPAGIDASAFAAVRARAHMHRLTVLGGIPGSAVRAGGPEAVRAGVAAGIEAAGGRLLVSDDGGVSTARELAALISALGAALGLRKASRGS